MIMSAAPAIAHQEAIEFIWQEADLLDSRDYAPWLSLWTAAGYYVVPIERAGGDHAAELNIVYDDQAMRVARVARLNNGTSTSASPPARTVRTVSRFRFFGVQEGASIVRCAQQLVEYKYERTRILAADVTYRLVRAGDALAIDGKVVRLINSDEALFGIAYLL